jgi:hypothetical protein
MNTNSNAAPQRKLTEIATMLKIAAKQSCLVSFRLRASFTGIFTTLS